MEAYCKVLIVEDEMLVRQGIRFLLDWEKEGFRIVGEASNGKEALELVEQHQPNIILTDIVMPIMDGEELVRIVKGLHPEIEIIVLSSFGEFDYVRSTFQSGVADYMLKPKLDAASLLAVLKKTRERLPIEHHREWPDDRQHSLDYILDRLISGYSIDYEAAPFQSELPYSAYMLLVVESDDASAAAKRNEDWMEALLKAEVQRSNKPIAIRRLATLDGHIRFLLNMDASNCDEVVLLAKELLESAVNTSQSLCAAISRRFDRIGQLHEAYSGDILNMLNHRFFLPDRRLLLADHVSEPQTASATFDLEAYSNELNRQDFHPALHRLDSYVRSMPGRLDKDMFEFKSFLGHSMFNMIVALLHFHYEANALDQSKYEYLRSIHEAKHIGEVMPLLESFMNEVMSCVDRSKTGTSGIQKILHYIDEHISEPLTLTEVAKQFHFNPSYLSNYFAVHNREGFNEYVNRVRIEKACKLLKGSMELSISEISSLVGYSDHSYFTKVFRKQMGISPSHYRKI
ncbi:response regulator transcription factor [Paenibacillus hexagrammi]|uniref:Response regulator transcription factor n=1 Tax=Paenibacillus hexagrammi TaxID=2908839 RepID=A0ABY3SMU2_9BACL|nr:response regulator transcription factor [Paenibacillus sp. YPD9-1]UJF34850.1 response regulator transcription factor [Paenibacillus sp. YPD9-1]